MRFALGQLPFHLWGLCTSFVKMSCSGWAKLSGWVLEAIYPPVWDQHRLQKTHSNLHHPEMTALFWRCAVAGAAYCHFITGLTYWDKQPFRLTFTPTGNRVSSVILPCFGSVGWNRMVGNPHRHRRACKLHNGRQWSSLQEKPSLTVFYPFK